MTSEEMAREWLDGPGGDACLASDQRYAVTLLAALIDKAHEAGRQEGKESPGRFECGNCHEVMLYKTGPLIEEIKQEERERAVEIVEDELRCHYPVSRDAILLRLRDRLAREAE